MIPQVATTDAVVADTEMTEPVHQTLTELELLPDMHVIDSGYTAAALLLAATKRGSELPGPARQQPLAPENRGRPALTSHRLG
ncbi:hypothetical protein OG894_29310 [Streptomyces sp. NBC_01724]|uniref:hypothetical protein n=1 Tax=Streptomyces sp. NBC_01724 TaxID=2975922 RepID=UPI002E356C57|nr:hypothetical protein [Streptomyces sp. NBC_01724]